MPEPRGPSAFVDEAYHLEDEASMVEFYRKWAADYDHQMLDELGYESPAMLAAELRHHLPDTGAAIFDIGCGTGLTCLPLAQWGYQNLDGIDLSPDMVRVAGQRGIYRELLVGDVNQQLERDDASYDGVISTGTFTHGHVGPEPLEEIFRILKPGGVLACTVHRDLWDSMGFKTAFDALIEQGIATCLSQRLDRYYRDSEPEGWFCIYRKSA
ncbi:MAG: class I SAM-dependent methyltransferase [Gammaproteobacteria bacterium]|jgi:predicted TPR repeat methyltransferase